jgi:uncharacterized protein (DUF2147 family)
MGFFPSSRRTVLFAALALLGLALAPRCEPTWAATAAADAVSSPVGRWKTLDDKTGKVKSIVEIREADGKLYGTIEQLFDPPVPHPTCYLCSGAKKDLPLVGLQVLWGFTEEGAQWSGGMVLDPETGKVYRASIALEGGGKGLRLHGYIGIPLLGRTEHWVRAE